MAIFCGSAWPSFSGTGWLPFSSLYGYLSVGLIGHLLLAFVIFSGLYGQFLMSIRHLGVRNVLMGLHSPYLSSAYLHQLSPLSPFTISPFCLPSPSLPSASLPHLPPLSPFPIALLLSSVSLHHPFSASHPNIPPLPLFPISISASFPELDGHLLVACMAIFNVFSPFGRCITF